MRVVTGYVEEATVMHDMLCTEGYCYAWEDTIVLS